MRTLLFEYIDKYKIIFMSGEFIIENSRLFLWELEIEVV